MIGSKDKDKSRERDGERKEIDDGEKGREVTEQPDVGERETERQGLSHAFHLTKPEVKLHMKYNLTDTSATSFAEW